MALINLGKNSEYEEEINDLKKTILELKEEIEYWKDLYKRDYRKIQEMKNLPSHQLPACELDKYEYGGLVSNSCLSNFSTAYLEVLDEYEYKALVSDSNIDKLIFPEEQPFKIGDYLLIKTKNDLNKSALARISDISHSTREHITSSFYKDFGFTNQDVFCYYLNLKYPDSIEKDKFYVYEIYNL